MATIRQWLARGILVLLSGLAGVAHAAPESGWWWNPSDSEPGFIIEIQGTQVYLGGYIDRNVRPMPVGAGTTLEWSWDFHVRN